MENSAASHKSAHSDSKPTPAISQAMILAAGKGTRLRPLTLETPKPLVKVGGQPLIVWHINALKKAGITDITINTSWLSEKLMAALGDGSEFGVTIHWSVEEDQPLETAGGIAKALHEGKLRDEPFLLINGDVWTEFDYASLIRHTLDSATVAHLIFIANPDHNPTGDFGIHNGRASTRPVNGTYYTFAGISIIKPILVESIQTDEVAALAPLLKLSMQHNAVTAQVIDSKWVDVGTPERLTAVNDYILQQTST